MTFYHFTFDEQTILYWFVKHRERNADRFMSFAQSQRIRNWNEHESMMAEGFLASLVIAEHDAGFADSVYDTLNPRDDDYIFKFHEEHRQWCLNHLRKEPARLLARFHKRHFGGIKAHTENGPLTADYSINGLCKAVYGFTVREYVRMPKLEGKHPPRLIYHDLDEDDTNKLALRLEALIVKLSHPIEQFWPVKGYDHVPLKHNLKKDELGNWYRPKDENKGPLEAISLCTACIPIGETLITCG